MISMIIVDDESFIRECLRTQIDWNRSGVTIAGTARNGEEALELVRNLRPQIVLTDVRMPKMNGISLMERAREIDKNVEFVFISGFQEFEYVKKAMNYGSCGYILKPIDPKELVEIIEKAVKRIKEKQILSERSGSFLEDAIYGGNAGNLLRESAGDMYRIFMIYYYGGHGMYDSVHISAYGKLSGYVEEMRKELGDAAMVLENNPRSVCIIIKDADAETLFEVSERWRYYLKQQMYQGGLRCYRIRLSEEICMPEQLQEMYFGMNRDILNSLYGKFGEEIEEIRALGGKIPECILKQDEKGLWKLLEELGQLIDKYYKTVEEKQDGLYIFVKWVLSNSSMGDNDCSFAAKYLTHAAANIYSVRNGADFWEAYQGFCSEFIACFQERETVYGKEALARHARDYIDKHFQDMSLCLTDIAEQVNVSGNYLSAVFSSAYECGIAAYINKVRIEEAKKLLENTSCKVNVIAERAGYENATYFSTLFKKSTGMSPKEFRNHVKGAGYGRADKNGQ